MRVRLIACVFAFMAACAVAGCGADGKGGDRPAAASGTGTTAVPSGAAASKTDAPGVRPSGTPDLLVFTAATVDGKPFAGVTLLGRPAVLWFWAPSSADCRAQAAETDKAAALWADRVAVVGVAGPGDPAAARDFVAATRTAGFPHLADGTGALWRRFEVDRPGTYVLLDAAGAVAFRGMLPRGEGLLGRLAALAPASR